MSVKRLVILFSGQGTNLEVLLQTLHGQTFHGTTLKVALTLTNKPNAGGIQRSLNHGITPVVVDHTQFESREAFDAAVVEIIQQAKVDLVVLAGFMRILTPVFTQQVKAINLHPSLLPLFKGAHAIRESFEADVDQGGVSVHFVNEELDGGEIIVQEGFAKEKGMSYEAFEAKIRQLEHRLLPEAVVKLLC